MTVLRFPPRVPEPARTLEDLRARKRSPHPSCDITVSKDARIRRYVILSDAPGYFVGEVWFGKAQHRRKRVAGCYLAKSMGMQFAREIADLVADGWTIDALWASFPGLIRPTTGSGSKPPPRATSA